MQHTLGSLIEQECNICTLNRVFFILQQTICFKFIIQFEEYGIRLFLSFLVIQPDRIHHVKYDRKFHFFRIHHGSDEFTDHKLIIFLCIFSQFLFNPGREIKSGLQWKSLDPGINKSGKALKR